MTAIVFDRRGTAVESRDKRRRMIDCWPGRRYVDSGRGMNVAGKEKKSIKGKTRKFRWSTRALARGTPTQPLSIVQFIASSIYPAIHRSLLFYRRETGGRKRERNLIGSPNVAL